MIESPPDPHVSPNKQFHSGDIPLLQRQNANQTSGTRSSTNLGVIGDDIYNGGSMMSGRSGISGLSEDDSMSSPPSPNVSSYQGDEDAERARYTHVVEEHSHYGNQRIAPSISVTNELQFPLNHSGDRGFEQSYTGSGHHVRENSNLSHAPSSSHFGLSQTSYFGISNMLGELSRSDYPPTSYHQDPTASLWVHHPTDQRSSHHSVHSEPIAISHGGHNQHVGPQSEYGGQGSPWSYHDDRRHRRHSPSSRHSHSDHSDRLSDHPSGYHSNNLDDPHHHNYHHHHHGNSHRRQDNRSESRSRSHSPKYPNQLSQTTPPNLSLKSGGHQYLSHRTLPYEGRMGIGGGGGGGGGGVPMRHTRSDDLGRSKYHFHDNSAQRSGSRSQLSDTESWVESTQRLHHSSEIHPPPSHPSHSSHSSHSTSGSDPIRESPPEPPQQPAPSEASPIIDSILLEAVGCLMHQENCRIPRCPCREVKKRFAHIIPQTKLHIQQEAERVTEDVQSGRFDPTDRRQQMRLSLSSQNISPDIHAHYHMTSRSHIRQSGGGMNRLKFIQRHRSKSMDLTPVMEQPGESCATTPGVVVPDSARGHLCGPAFSPAITPAGETLRVLSPTTPSAGPLVSTVLLREISLSADNLPALCLNDSSIAATPLMQLGKQPLGSNIRSPLSTAQHRWSGGSFPDPPHPAKTNELKESVSSDEGHPSDCYTSQDSSNSLHTTSTQSSSGNLGKPDGTSAFDDPTTLPNHTFDEKMSTSRTASDSETSLRRKEFQMKGKQGEIEIPQQQGKATEYRHLESGYSTNSDVTDPESSLPSNQRPSDLPVSSLKAHPVTPKIALPPEPPQNHWGTTKKAPPTSSALSWEQPVQMHLHESPPLTAKHPAAKKVPFSSLQEKCSSTTCDTYHQYKTIEVTSEGRKFAEVENPEETNQREGVSIIYGDCPIPDYMTLITTLSDCTSEGRQFTDEDNDFSLEIPEGAIPEGERLTVDVGVALFGPFQFPEGLRPVSPVFWVCVRDNPNFQFSKPVTVTIPHFLDLENDEDIKSLGLTFLKADHNLNCGKLYPTDGEMKFEPFQKFGVLKTTHFRSLCIACRDRPDVLTKTRFCITSVLPKCATIGKKQNAFFFITFYNLSTCLAKVDELITEKKLEHYEKTQLEFKFERFTKNPALEMIVTQPKDGKIEVIGLNKV